MIPFVSTIRVGYSDTDQMGIVHHSNYLKYYETARWNMFRQLGAPYKKLEEKGFLLPVISMQIEFLKPAFYDEKLTIETSIVSFKGAKMLVRYNLFNEEMELINKAEVTLAFVNTQSRKACKPPDFIKKSLNAFFTPVLKDNIKE
jgi:acyl-CoA thioester hydrolase